MMLEQCWQSDFHVTDCRSAADGERELASPVIDRERESGRRRATLNASGGAGSAAFLRRHVLVGEVGKLRRRRPAPLESPTITSATAILPA
jgi:hypothetical protein